MTTPLSKGLADTITDEVERRLASLKERTPRQRDVARDVTDFARHVRLGTWTEHWPETDDPVRRVQAGIWSDAIDAALQCDDAVYLPRRDTPYYIDRPIVLSSGQSLFAEAEAEIRLVPGTGTCMLRNRGVMACPDGPVPTDTQPDCDIVIHGGTWTTLATGPGESNGNDRGRARTEAPCPGSHGTLLLHNIHNVWVRGCTISRCRPFGVQIGHAEGFLVEQVQYHEHRRDGVHVEGPASWGVVRGLSGITGDDVAALNAWDWHQYSMTFGPIDHVLVEDIAANPSARWGELRMLPGIKRFDDGTLLDCPVTHCAVRRVRGIHAIKLYAQPNLEAPVGADRSVGVGRLEDIELSDILVSTPAPEHFPGDSPCTVQVHADVQGLSLDRVRLEFNPDAFPNWRLVEVGPKSATYTYKADDPSTRVEIFEPDLDCTVESLSITDVTYNDEPVSPQALLKQTDQPPNPDWPRTCPRGGCGKVRLCTCTIDKG